MNFNRPRWGEWIAAIAGAELLLVIFRAWYKVSGTDAKVNAWDALESGRYLLLAAGVLGIVLLLATAAEQAADSRVSIARIVAVVGVVALGYTAYRIATPPADSVDATTGAFLGALAALGIAGGAYTAAREPLGEEAYEAPGAETSEAAGGWAPAGATGPTEFGGSGQWSPTPAAQPAVAQAGAGGEMPLAAGDQVALTAGGSRWPSGTVARVIQVFAGGALVEVNAPDGGAERFEVPEEAFERVGAGSTPGFTAGTGDWSPAMPSAAGTGEATSDDWGFEEGAAAGAVAGAAVADGDGEKRPGFFKRIFGGGRKERTEDIGDGDVTPTTDMAGIGSAAESDTDIGEATTADFDQPEPQIAHEPEAAAREPEVTIDEPPAPEPEVTIDEPPAPEPEVTIDEPPAPEPEPEVVIDEPPTPEPDPEPQVTVDEPAAPEVPVDETPPPADEPVVDEPVVDEPVVEPPVVAPPVEESPAPEPPVEEPAPTAAAEESAPAAKKRAPRKRSSGSRKVPKKAVEAAEAAAAGGDAPPSVGDQVALKVGGGRWDAGAKGTVVDVFSAGVIVEFADDDGNTERLDLPFEAVGPA